MHTARASKTRDSLKPPYLGGHQHTKVLGLRGLLYMAAPTNSDSWNTLEKRTNTETSSLVLLLTSHWRSQGLTPLPWASQWFLSRPLSPASN